MKNILYVNACVTREVESRTNRFAQAYLEKSLENQEYVLSTVVLEDTIMHPFSGKLLAKREKAIANKDFSDPCFDLAKIFAAAGALPIILP